MPPKFYVGIEHGIRFDLHLTCMISGKRDFLRFFAGYKEMINEKQKHPQTRMNTGFTGVFIMARPEGFEPPAFGIGIT